MSLVQALGIQQTCAPRIGTGFGGGMAGHGETCGALIGAIMATGLKYGRDEAVDLQAKSATSSRIFALLNAFKNEFGTVKCCDLIGCDLLTQEGNERFQRENLHVDLCTKFVAFTAREAFRLLEE